MRIDKVWLMLMLFRLLALLAPVGMAIILFNQYKPSTTAVVAGLMVTVLLLLVYVPFLYSDNLSEFQKFREKPPIKKGAVIILISIFFLLDSIYALGVSLHHLNGKIAVQNMYLKPGWDKRNGPRRKYCKTGIYLTSQPLVQRRISMCVSGRDYDFVKSLPALSTMYQYRRYPVTYKMSVFGRSFEGFSIQ